MCSVGGGGGDNSAEESRLAEEERQRRIVEGTNRVNQIFGGDLREFVPGAQVMSRTQKEDGSFADTPTGRYDPYTIRNTGSAPGQFGDDFYSNLEKSYLDYYNPQLADQYERARKNTIFSYANAGNLDSSAGAGTLADLEKENTLQLGRLSEGAVGTSRGKRADLESERANLIAQLESGSGVDTVASSAAARAAALSQPQQYSPLGDLFGRYTGNLVDSAMFQRKGYEGWGVRGPDGKKISAPSTLYVE